MPVLGRSRASLWRIAGEAADKNFGRRKMDASDLHETAPYLINPASRGNVRLISGMQMINSNPANSASMYGT
jgi:hypothetical protein